MFTKVKTFFYGSSAALLAAPAMVAAQYAEPTGTNLPAGSISGAITTLMMWVLGIVGAIAIIAFAIAGIMYLTAAGDEDRIATAKRAMIYSIIGVIVALIGLIILSGVNAWLGGTTTF